MTDRDDIEMLAAEYALGTLEDAERAEVAARRQREADLDALIVAWEGRLSPFIEEVAPDMPRADLLAMIEARIHQSAGIGSLADSGGQVVELRNRLGRWRSAALIGYAVAAGLAGFIVMREAVFPPPEQNFVAVFQKDDAQPAFLLTIDLKTRELTVRPVSADPQPGKTYQLWIASDRLAPGPQSLGLLEDIGAPTRKRLDQFDPDLLQNATFGISVEPEGGSPTGRPTSPAIHGKLYPTSL